MKRLGVIDIGTNSIKFHVAELTLERKIVTILDEIEITKLGEGLRETGVLSYDAMIRNRDVISKFVSKARSLHVDKMIGVGTMALRRAENALEFIDMIKKANDLEIKVISGEEEASLSYQAALSGLEQREEDIAIFDTGGGSTEFIFGNKKDIQRKHSVDLGALTVTESYFKEDPVKDGDLKRALEDIRHIFEDHGVGGSITQLIGVGGTVTSLAAVKHKMTQYDPDIIQGSMLGLEELNEQIALYASKTIQERKRIVGLSPKRAEIILGGACIVKVIMEMMSMDFLTVSNRGLRHALAYEWFNGK